MSTRRKKVDVPLPEQPEPTLAQQLAQVEASIQVHEGLLAPLRKRQADLKKQLAPPEKLWPCRYCSAQLRYSEVYKHTQDHFESEVVCD